MIFELGFTSQSSDTVMSFVFNQEFTHEWGNLSQVVAEEEEALDQSERRTQKASGFSHASG